MGRKVSSALYLVELGSKNGSRSALVLLVGAGVLRNFNTRAPACSMVGLDTTKTGIGKPLVTSWTRQVPGTTFNPFGQARKSHLDLSASSSLQDSEVAPLILYALLEVELIR